jgi:hypothetical protein
MGDQDDPKRLEVAYALRHDVRVVPVLVAGATMPAERDLPPDLADLAHRNPWQLSDERWTSGVDALAEALLTAEEPA